MRAAALTALSFKAFMETFESSIEDRLVCEQREMTAAFHTRGTQEIKDVESPDLNDGKIPILMVKSEGRRFFDPLPSGSGEDPVKHGYHAASDDSAIPGGFKIHKFRVIFQLDVGIVGWQLVWMADGIPRDIEGPKRGKWKGGALTTKEIVVPRDDFVVGVEYLYEANAMYGIRFKLHFGGWTKMIGKKNSLSTLTMYLGVEQVPVEPFEADYMYAGRDEEHDPGFPRRFIIGFCGIEGPVRATCMGLVVRKVKYQHIFSYNWVQGTNTHLLTHSPNHLLTHSPNHLLTHSLTHLKMRWMWMNKRRRTRRQVPSPLKRCSRCHPSCREVGTCPQGRV